MAEIRIRVGAAVDPSLQGVFRAVEAVNRQATAIVVGQAKARAAVEVAQMREAARMQRTVYDSTQRFIRDGDKARLAVKLATLKAETSAAQNAAKAEIAALQSVARERDKAAREAARLARSSGGVVGASFGGGRGG